MQGFTTKIDLLHRSVFIKELKVKHFKILLKVLIGDEPDIDNVYTNLTNVLTDTTSLTVTEIDNLSIIDYLLLIINLRCISIGSTIQLEITDTKNTKLSLNLYRIIETLKGAANIDLNQNFDKLKLEFQFISAKDYLMPKFYKNELLALKPYIKTFNIKNNESIDISSLDDIVYLQLLESLPVHYSAPIFKKITSIVQNLNNLNLLEYLANKNMSLYFSRYTFGFFLQILFSKNLQPLYENIFALAKFANISPEYIEECTPGEYTLFVKLLERILKEQNAQRQTINSLPPINKENPNFM